MPTHAELVTPERVLFEGEADFVVLRTEGGEIMFLPEHAPFIGAVDISVVRIAPAGSEGMSRSSEQDRGDGGSSSGGASGTGTSSGGQEFRAAVHGGFVHVADNAVTVLASVAEPADEIDVERARRAREAAASEVAAGGGDDGKASQRQVPAAAGPAAGGEGEEPPAEQSAAMKALLAPDDPEVALRRAEVRLEAVGELGPPAPVGTGSAGH